MKWLYKYEKWWGKIIFLAAILLYINTIPNFYNLDDELVTKSHRLTSKGISAIPEILKSYYYEDKFGHKYDYRPIVHISFALEHELLGESPHISHAINTFLYALMCWLLFVFLSSLFPQKLKLLAWVATLLFVFHPMHTEVVASIKNRDELMALGFALLAAIFSLKYIDEKKWLFLVIAVVSFILALLSKITVLSFFVIIPLSIIIFREAKIKNIFSIGLPMVLVVFFISKLTIGQNIFLALFSIIFLFFIKFLDEKNKRTKWLKNYLLNLKNQFKNINKKIKNWPEEPIIQLFEDNKQKHLLALNITLFIFFLLAFYVFKFNYLLIFFVLLAMPFLIKFNYLNSLSLILLYFALLILNTRHSLIPLNSLVLVYFALQIYLSKKNTLIFLNILFYLLSIALLKNDFQIISFHFVGYALYAICVFILKGINYKYKNQVFAVITILLLIVKMYFLNLNFSFILLLLVIVFILMTVFLKKHLHGLSIKILFVLFVYILFQALSNLSFQQYFYTTENINSFIEKPLDDKSEYRPLFFAESPVNMNNSLSERLGTGADIFGKYLKKLALPNEMGFYYGYAYITPKHISNLKPLFLFFSFLALIFLSFFLKYKNNQVLSFGLLFFLISLIPILNIFYPIAGVVADRYLLIPSIAFCLILATGVLKFSDYKKTIKFSFIILSLILISYSYITVNRNFDWKDKLTLFESDINYLHKSAQAHALLGSEYMSIARKIETENDQKTWIQKSKNQYNKAIEIYPNFWNWYFINGINNQSLGLYEEAIKNYKKSIEIKPGFSYEPYYYIAYIYYEKNNFIEASKYFEYTLENGFNKPEIYNYLASCYTSLNIPENAISSLQEGLILYPNDYNLNLNLGKAFYNISDFQNAKVYLSKALNIDDSDKKIVSLLESIQ